MGIYKSRHCASNGFIANLKKGTLAILLWRGAETLLVIMLAHSASTTARCPAKGWQSIGANFTQTALKQAGAERERGSKSCILHPPNRPAGLSAARALRAKGFMTTLKGRTLAIWW